MVRRFITTRNSMRAHGRQGAVLLEVIVAMTIFAIASAATLGRFGVRSCPVRRSRSLQVFATSCVDLTDLNAYTTSDAIVDASQVGQCPGVRLVSLRTHYVCVSWIMWNAGRARGARPDPELLVRRRASPGQESALCAPASVLDMRSAVYKLYLVSSGQWVTAQSVVRLGPRS